MKNVSCQKKPNKLIDYTMLIKISDFLLFDIIGYLQVAILMNSFTSVCCRLFGHMIYAFVEYMSYNHS